MVIVTQNLNILSGAPCFAGTRVPVGTLFDTPSARAALNQFFEWSSGVGLKQVKAVWRQAADAMQKRITY